MTGGDYFAWVDRHTRGRRRSRPELEARAAAQEIDVAPSEPIQVEEHHVSTTIIERIREGVFSVLGKRG